MCGGIRTKVTVQNEAEASVKHHLNEAELVLLRNPLVHIAEDVGGSTTVQCKPRTILLWVREFILDQEDLQLQLLG